MENLLVFKANEWLWIRNVCGRFCHVDVNLVICFGNVLSWFEIISELTRLQISLGKLFFELRKGVWNKYLNMFGNYAQNDSCLQILRLFFQYHYPVDYEKNCFLGNLFNRFKYWIKISFVISKVMNQMIL